MTESLLSWDVDRVTFAHDCARLRRGERVCRGGADEQEKVPVTRQEVPQPASEPPPYTLSWWQERGEPSHWLASILERAGL